MADTSILKDLQEKLGSWTPAPGSHTVGTVEKSADGIVTISGLPDTKSGELLNIQTPVGPISAMALNLDTATIGAVIFGDFSQVEAGMTVLGTGEVASVPVGPDMVGRVLNALAEPIDGKPAPKAAAQYPVENVAPGVIARKSVSQPLQTGILAIDAMIPIGRGQRELIIGDRGTGKTALAVDTIINQKDSGVICIYVAIGQKESKVARLKNQLEKHGAMDHTIIISAGASDPAPMQYIAPYVGCALGEYFIKNGKDALIIFDDLSKHAWAYREISLLLRRPPGREAYPGDVFYLHSRLLERACRVTEEFGGGSLTALPVIETQAGDISAYIPTNVISITDGQIFCESDLFYQGIRPAVNVGLSVSRVGGAAQIKAMKKVAGQLRLELAQYRELAAFAQFGSDLDEATRRQIERGKRLTELLKQPQYQPIPVEEQVLILTAATSGALDSVAVEKISEVGVYLREQFKISYSDLLKEVATKGSLSDESAATFKKAITDTVGDFKKQS